MKKGAAVSVKQRLGRARPQPDGRLPAAPTRVPQTKPSEAPDPLRGGRAAATQPLTGLAPPSSHLSQLYDGPEGGVGSPKGWEVNLIKGRLAKDEEQSVLTHWMCRALDWLAT